MKDLLELIKDKTESNEKRAKAAYLYALLGFAERIDEKTVMITSDTIEKVETFTAILRTMQEIK